MAVTSMFTQSHWILLDPFEVTFMPSIFVTLAPNGINIPCSRPVCCQGDAESGRSAIVAVAVEPGVWLRTGYMALFLDGVMRIAAAAVGGGAPHRGSHLRFHVPRRSALRRTALRHPGTGCRAERPGPLMMCRKHVLVGPSRHVSGNSRGRAIG